MTFGLRSNRFPFLRDYDAALRKHEEIKPLRGKHEGTRPLSERRRNWLDIREVLDIRKVGEGDLVLRLYNTDIATYKVDGSILLTQGGWDSVTTRQALNAIAPCTLHQQHGQTWLTANNGSFPISSRKVAVLSRNLEDSRNSVRSAEVDGRGDSGYRSGAVCYMNPDYPTVHKLNRTAYNQIKKRHYQPFIDYLLASYKLRNQLAPNKEETEAAVGERYYEPMPLPELMDLINSGNPDHPESWYVASVVVMRRCAPSTFRGWREESPAVMSIARLKREIKDMICTTHRDEVFTAYEVRDGRVVKDSNAKYFK